MFLGVMSWRPIWPHEVNSTEPFGLKETSVTSMSMVVLGILISTLGRILLILFDVRTHAYHPWPEENFSQLFHVINIKYSLFFCSIFLRLLKLYLNRKQARSLWESCQKTGFMIFWKESLHSLQLIKNLLMYFALKRQRERMWGRGTTSSTPSSKIIKFRPPWYLTSTKPLSSSTIRPHQSSTTKTTHPHSPNPPQEPRIPHYY